jgi:Tetratricopeptide repeat
MAATAESLNRLGIELSDQARWDDAEHVYLRATQLDPTWSVPWYNLGLNYKRQRRWSESMHANMNAVELDPEDGDAWWNLGIAATGAGDWELARRAWRACGIPIPDGTGPIEVDFGLTPVRLNPELHGEVVWAHRIDPARAIVANVPLPESGYCEGDIVLHDGAANGYRELDGQEVPVFDVLQRLAPSGRKTFEVWIRADSQVDMDDLFSLGNGLGLTVEDWTGSVANICKACSEGRPHAHHDTMTREWVTERRVGVSALSADDVEVLLRCWSNADRNRVVLRR